MPQNESVTLHELQSSSPDIREQDPDGPDPAQDVSYESSTDRNYTSQNNSHRTRLGHIAASDLGACFAMSYGVFQEYYYENWTLDGSRAQTGIIGTTQNGVMYLSMPFLFALFTKRWARWRQTAALCGTVLACLSFILSSFSTNVWHLIVTQGVMAALGCALIYSPMTLSLGEWFQARASNQGAVNRAVAYGVVLSSKNIVGSTCPFLFRGLLDHYEFRATMRIWTALLGGICLLGIALIPTHPTSMPNASRTHRTPKIPWHFLRHKTFYIYSTAIIFQSAGYGIPQTYINQYGKEITMLSQTWATLLLTLFNVPGIIASSFFGYLSDNKLFPLSAATVASIPPISSACSAFLLWGLTSQGSGGLALLILFSITFGFFSSGYSATWGGFLNELEREAAQANEAIDAGMMYGLLNGARGIGYVSGGFASVPLLKAGSGFSGKFAYGTTFGPLIIFTGLTSVLGGCVLIRKWEKQLLRIFSFA
ncbi:Monocarboxylate transporter [Lachnellula hyalina]|uniref:Monocarboxylate transporter n=1 Tax=Lachnellula hyalina TaxID=1316788 RepID=A0A8H8R8E6_9HELO|nr:Monocarboxylate transporter [Lachnellula hyalina]TVY30335.1 Monocarboxylate transporter [Lachnellula hyalina]